VSLKLLARRAENTSFFEEVAEWSKSARSEDALRLDGLPGSLPALLGAHLSDDRPLAFLAPDAEEAAHLADDLTRLLTGDAGVALVPPSRRASYDDEHVGDTAPLIERTDALQQLSSGEARIAVTSTAALAEKAPPPDVVRSETMTVALGDEEPPDELAALLTSQGFRRVEFVEEPGDVALRGGILDAYPFAGDYPVRIEFFGDEIDAIREFDVRTQRSVSRRSAARLTPNLEEHALDRRAPLFAFLPDDALLLSLDEQKIREDLNELRDEAQAAYDDLDDDARAEHPAPDALYLSEQEFTSALWSRPRLLLGAFSGSDELPARRFEASPQVPFNSNMELLRQRIDENAGKSLDTLIFCDSEGQQDRLSDLLSEQIEEGQARLLVETLHAGFEAPPLELAVYTDHQIFNRYHRPKTRKRSAKGGLTRQKLQSLTLGDFVVHTDYGIGTFAGMREIEVRGTHQEAVRLRFRDDDVLYVNVNALHKLNKFTGKEGHQPRLTKLGSGRWERKKAQTKSEVKDMARDLIELYAKRKESKGFGYSEDSVWQRELEASFEFEDTPDQAAATEAVKRDMQNSTPMDRLICGDVGFGKTEIAVRAAFKAVQDGKQVAVLVPTTILADQHYETFSRRLERFPVNVDVLSRFRTRSEQKETLKRLENGQVDVIIGTHRLASKDVEFNELGLFVIDEEQRFGVKTKERLREVRVNVDTLTLTATPIPRTLQFSLLGARDLSIIGTPPPNRQPIETEIHTFDEDLIHEAIRYEMSRGGQVFFIHNRVKTINEMAETVRAIAPDVRVRVAHGQMQSNELEDVMHDFIEGRFDVLLSTNIIENGLDISNTNTMIINRADRFGLGELHQLRGRVGRSKRKAFCYLMVPSVSGLTREARQRLQAVEEFSDLGEGFNIAMRDLDIRGAGTLLGGEQSGFIADVGYETYHKILDDAVKELRSDEFADVFEDDAEPPAPDAQVDVEANAFLPEDYVSNNVERLNLYRRISEAEDGEALEALREELADRFGAVPEPTRHLLRAAELRLLSEDLRLPKLAFKNERLFLHAPAEEDDPYFYEHLFQPLLQQLNGLERRVAFKDEQDGPMRAIVQNVPNLDAARELMQRLGRGEREAAMAA
jgi:transcription-repair coupling factor (superfamily II helicase)